MRETEMFSLITMALGLALGWLLASRRAKKKQILDRRIVAEFDFLDKLGALARRIEDALPQQTGKGDRGWQSLEPTSGHRYQPDAETRSPITPSTTVEAPRDHASSSGSDPAIESFPDDKVVATLLRRFDTETPRLEEIQDVVAKIGRSGEAVHIEAPDQWRLLAISRPGTATWLLVPCLHVAMGSTPLADFFDLSNYSGVDPIQARQVRKAAVVTKSGSGWKTIERGLIDAHRWQ